ncbi:MAG: DUF5696 domain-containing protein [Roseburia sp.]|nr:DUF5696 domain-containing protein [Roseburia sp.]
MKKEKSVRKAEIKTAFIKWAKSLIVPVIFCAIIVGVVIFVINYQNAQEEEELIRVNGYEGDQAPMIMENDKLKFTLYPETTQFEVEVKSSGKIWRSNPEDAANDTLALANEKSRQQSTLAMSYTEVTGLETQFNSYEQSVKNGLYEIEGGENYITVKYSLGNIEREYIIPPVCTEEHFEGYLSQMSKDGLNMVKQYYKKYDINNLGKKDDKEELLAKYPILETEIIYVLRDNTSSSLRTKMEEYFEEIGYTMEQYTADKELNLAESTSDKPVFNINMTYRLEDDELVVEIPLKEMEYKEEYPIYTITPLPYFGAGGVSDEGYILVPEGGGAIINFNNGKTAQNSYYANMYGWDMALEREAVVHNTRAYYNTFGIAQGNDSFLCTLEEGAPYASVQADISGKTGSYNYVNSVYSITMRERYDVGNIANSAIYVFIPELPDETLTQRYHFIDSGDYADMAKEYQGYLKEKYGDYLVEREDTETPLVVEIVGAVDKVRQILGVPVSRPLELTSYKEAQQMIEELSGEGIKNMSVKLSGWCNGGVNQKILTKVKTISALGSKKDLKSLTEKAKELGVDLYLDGVTHYEYDSNILNGFFSYTDAARFVSKERAELFIYSDVTYAARDGVDSYYLLHNDLALEMADNLIAAANQYGAGVSFKDTGMDLSADYYLKKTVSRQQAKENQVEQLQNAADAGTKIMVNMGNDYAIAYSDMITNMDLQGSEYTILDQYVPFYQLAIHGLVNYTGMPLNICGNTEDELLRCAEYGAGLYFTMMQESAFTLQKTLYTEYYGSDYAVWHDRMMEIYTRYNTELGHVFNQQMTDHQILAEGLSCTVYEDGTKVYVNYNYVDAASPDGVTVAARDYKVVR